MMHADPFRKRDVAPELRTPQAVNVLFLSICPIVLWFLRGSATDVLAALVLVALFAAARVFLIRGILADDLFEKTQGAEAPTRPNKLIGAGLMGVAITALASYRLEALMQPIVFGLATGALTVLIFGRDPDIPKRNSGKADAALTVATDTSDQIADDLQDLVVRVEHLGDAGATRMAIALRNTVLAEQRALRRDVPQLTALHALAWHSIEDATEAADQLAADLASGPNPAASEDFALIMTEILEDFEEEATQFTVSDASREDAHLDDMLSRMDREFAA